MEDFTIREAQRLLAELVAKGWATMGSGKRVEPKDEALILLFERVAKMKLPKSIETPTLEGVELRTTYHGSPKASEDLDR